jgi:hypothetical protein
MERAWPRRLAVAVEIGLAEVRDKGVAMGLEVGLQSLKVLLELSDLNLKPVGALDQLSNVRHPRSPLPSRPKGSKQT